MIWVPILVELFYKFEEGKLKKDTLISFDDSLKKFIISKNAFLKMRYLYLITLAVGKRESALI